MIGGESLMNISLTHELEKFVSKKVDSGMYHSASEVVRDGLRLLKERDEIHRDRLAELRKQIAVRLKQLAEGEYTVYNEKSLEQLLEKTKAKGRTKLMSQRRKIRP